MKRFLVSVFLTCHVLAAGQLGAEPVPSGPMSYPAGHAFEAPVTDFWSRASKLANPEKSILDAACCKVCRQGKACGDSCISRSYTCRKGVGCACDG